MSLENALNAWRTMPDAPGILAGPAAEETYGMDCSSSRRRIPAALRVTSEDQLREVMRIACANQVPVHPVSTGRNWGYGSALPAAEDTVLLDLSGMRRIDFDQDFGVVTVEPGVTQGQLARHLDDHGLDYMVPTTGAGPECSLVGNALERGYGITPHGDHFAAVTDLRAVLADGSLYRGALAELAGERLARLFRWGLGPYSAGLFTQSGFGIVTSMSIVLVRRPPAVKVGLFSLRGDELLGPAVDRVRDALAALPGVVGGINLMNRHRVLAMTAPYPRERLGPDGLIPADTIAALGRQYQVEPWTGFTTLYGTERIVAAAQRELRSRLRGVAHRLLFLSPAFATRLQRLSRWLPGASGARLGRTAGTLAASLQLVSGRPNQTALPLAYWRHRRPDIPAQADPSRDGAGLIWYAPLVAMKADTVQAFVAMARRVTVAHGMEPLITLTSLNDRLFDSTVPLLFDAADPEAAAAARRCYDQLVEAGRELGHGAQPACYPYRLGVDGMGRMAATDADSLHRRLRAAVDPGDLLAPGRYGGPLNGAVGEIDRQPQP